MRQLFNDGWKFSKTAIDADKPGVFTPVDLPHDWLIYQAKDLYEDSIGWYVKSFNKPEGEYVSLRFDGVYMDSVVFVNGNKAKEWKYGYSTFDVDITEFLADGRNEVMVKVCHQSPNSRWYSGAGIYRNVWLTTAPTLHLVEDGVYFSTQKTDDGYMATISAEVTQAARREDAVVQYLMAQKDENGTKEFKVLASCAVDETVNLLIPDVLEWSLDEPNLYELHTKLILDGRVQDETCCTVGFRNFELDPAQGLILNGKRVKLHGVCEHHDLGCLGAAFNPVAMERKFKILRDMGVNSIRASHNMPAPELMELADRYGFVIDSEAFDMWENSKTTYDYARFFKEYSRKDVASWVRRDRNHPSVFFWSIGNEIYDTHKDEHGQDVMRMLMSYVEENDPRLNGVATFGSNYMPWENTQKCADIIKVVGYNYAEKYYAQHHEEHPDWVIYGSETSSIVQSRGVYHFPMDVPCLSDEDEQCSSLGNSITSWGARQINKCIADDRDTDFAFGMYIWTGFDYIGEPTPYHTKNSYFGQADTAGFPKDSYYQYKAEWTDVKTSPFVHLFPYWDFSVGQIIDVCAATNGSSVELLVNGKSQGIHEIDHAAGTDQLGHWVVPYEPGEITAIAYDENGKEIARQSRHSFGDSKSIVLSCDKTDLLANGEDLIFITIETLDGDGYPVENAADRVKVKVTGPAVLKGLDNGDSTDYDEYKTNVRKLFNGKLLAVIGATDKPGTIEVEVTGPGLEAAKALLVASPANMREGTSCYYNACIEAADPTVKHVRRIDVTADNYVLNKEHPSAIVEARVLPQDAADKEIIWQVVNRAGIEISRVKVENLGAKDGVSRAKLTALSDGDIAVRALSKDGSDGVRIISRLELKCDGIGETLINPYEFVSAALHTDAIGDIAGGNEKGIAFSREMVSTAIFDDIDFGSFGSDEVELPIFALSDDPHQVEIWEGRPEEGELLLRFDYQKPSIWNVYQPETVKLARRLKGVTTMSIRSSKAMKFHLKGFQFRKLNKAYTELAGADCTDCYGDSYKLENQRITGIGNNVTIVYDDMDFTDGASKVTIRGTTPLNTNTIHLHFVPENGDLINNILEFPGGVCESAFDVRDISGKGRVELVFLPGSNFDFDSICFE